MQDKNIENGVISTNYDFINDNRSFSADVGTSFAAPMIANLAAKIFNRLPDVSANTVRALLANAASYPEEIYSLLTEYMVEKNQEFVEDYLSRLITKISNEKLKEIIKEALESGRVSKSAKNTILTSDELPSSIKNKLKLIPACSKDSNEIDKYIFRLCGYGKPEFERAVFSSENQVSFFAENFITVDSFDIYEVPIPEEFINQKGIRKIIISLAYSPLTRHTRKDYHAYSMSFELLRGIKLDRVIELAGNENKDLRYTNFRKERIHYQWLNT